MLSVIVFVLANGAVPVLDVDPLELPPQVLQSLAERFVDDITTTLWGHWSFSTLAVVGIDARATFEQMLIAERVEELRRERALQDPFRIGRGWTCGVGLPP